MTFPAEHFGALRKRTWYKVRWLRNPPGLRLAGTFDLLLPELCRKYKEFVEILDTVQTEECAVGLPIGFGKPEAEVDAWIQKNRT